MIVQDAARRIPLSAFIVQRGGSPVRSFSDILARHGHNMERSPAAWGSALAGGYLGELALTDSAPVWLSFKCPFCAA